MSKKEGVMRLRYAIRARIAGALDETFAEAMIERDGEAAEVSLLRDEVRRVKRFLGITDEVEAQMASLSKLMDPGDRS